MMRYDPTYHEDFTLPCAGKVFRHYKPKSPCYDDFYVQQFVGYIGDQSPYNLYKIVPKSIENSRTSIARFNKPLDPLGDLKIVYDYCALWLYDEFSFWRNSLVIDYDQALTKIDPTKSPGYPWILKYQTKGDYFVSDDSDWFYEYWNALGTTDPHLTFSSVSIKEELRTAIKVDKHSVRTIIAKDVNHILASTMLFQQQQEMLIANHLKCCSALGHSLFNGGAQELYDYLHPWSDVHEPTLYSIDGVQYDSNYHQYAFKKVYDVRYDMLHPEFKNTSMKNRVDNIRTQVHTTVLCDIDGVLWLKESGNDSGQKLTTDNNIEKNFLDWSTLWCLCAPEKFRSYAAFKEFVRILFVGDDIIMSVHPSVKSFFNYESINFYAPHIGMQYEWEHKIPKQFSDVSFVGHRFVYTYIPILGKSMWLPTIDCEKMRSSALHFNTKVGTPEHLLNSLTICSGLRNETFACESCREWFAQLWAFLFSKLDSDDPHRKQVLSQYLSDNFLWNLYVGFEHSDIKAGILTAIINSPAGVDPSQ